MKSDELAAIWKEIVCIFKGRKYNETPNEVMDTIIQTFGMEKTEEVFATVAIIKAGDGRIYGLNRDYMDSIPVNPDAVRWGHGNCMIYAGLDEIHPTHINQLITQLRNRKDKKKTSKKELKN